MRTVCQSTLHHVTVHARGAIVTRRVQMPDALADGDVELVVPQITLLADGASVRATLRESNRSVASVETSIHLPAAPVTSGPPVMRIRELASRITRLHSEDRLLGERRRLIDELPVSPRVRKRDHNGRPKEALDARLADALAAVDALETISAEIDARRLQIGDELRKLGREMEGAKLVLAQSPTKEARGEPAPPRCT